MCLPMSLKPCRRCWTLAIVTGVSSSLVEQGWHHWTAVEITTTMLSPLEGKWRRERSLAVIITAKLCLVLTIQLPSISDSFLRTQFRRKKGGKGERKRSECCRLSCAGSLLKMLGLCRRHWRSIQVAGDVELWSIKDEAAIISKKREEERICGGEMIGIGFWVFLTKRVGIGSKPNMKRTRNEI